MSASLTQTAFRAFALASIQLYRAWLSPIKGFHCAWGVYAGRDTCSGVGLRAFRRAGWRRGWLLMQRQFDRCALAAEALRAGQGRYRRLAPRAGQRGSCDFDLPGDDCCDVLDCADAVDCSDGRSSPARERRGCRRDCRGCARDWGRCCSPRRSRVEDARERALQRARERQGRRNAAAPPGAQRAT